ncbi:unnamed protein product [Cuscuta campestris]|uniref:Uncharacterized protein n=1 Tax=Cuscuta campestris TaxID=132261 RepID=A0A484LBR0_9ASTE|nr:unnamed protein product [Cuscuta campestris]
MPLATGNKQKKKKKALKGDESVVDGYGDAVMPNQGGQPTSSARTKRGDDVVLSSNKKLKTKLHLPNSGADIGKLSPKSLNWSEIGISGRVPSGLAKKGDLKNDYKLILELVIGCLECGSGGHADDITQKRAFIINDLITKTKVNWAKHFFNSIFKHIGKPRQKFLYQGLYIGHVLKTMDIATDGKKYEERYWLYYLSRKGENRNSFVAEEEGSSNEVMDIALKKASKRKQVVSSSPSAEEQRDLEMVNLDEEEISAQGQLQKKKNRRISTPSTSGDVNPENSLENHPQDSPHPLDEETHQEQTGNHVENITEETQADLEAGAEDFLIFPENSSALEITFVETLQEDVAIPQPEEQIQAIAKEEEIMHSVQFQVQDILTITCEISNQAELEIRKCTEGDPHLEGKSEEHLEKLSKSTPPDTTEEEIRREPEVEAQRSLEEAGEDAQIASLEVAETLVAIFEQQNAEVVRDPISQEISNYKDGEAQEGSVKILKINEEDDEEGEEAESLPLQSFHSIPPSTQKDIRSALAVSSANQVVTQDYLKVLAENQKEVFRLLKEAYGTFIISSFCSGVEGLWLLERAVPDSYAKGKTSILQVLHGEVLAQPSLYRRKSRNIVTH